MAQLNEVAARIMEHLVTHDGDGGHGYTQGARWGTSQQESIEVDGKRFYFAAGDRDCSSAIISAYQAAGLKVDATYTGNMRAGFLATGKFSWQPMSFTAQRGDIYLNEANHTAMCTSAVPDMLAQFSISENGTIYGRQGDQTGSESHIREYYSYPWDGILHFEGGEAAPSKPSGSAKPTLPNWRVKQAGKWLAKNAKGQPGKPITALAIQMPGWYQVCTEHYGWLDVIRGYDINNEDSGYAGWRDSPITAVRAYYETPNPDKTGWLSAKYRVSTTTMSEFYSWQYDNDTWNGQDGYAGDLWNPIDQFEITVE